MKSRLLVYLAMVAVFFLAVQYKIYAIKKKQSVPTVSILKEWEKYGKPVEVYDVDRGNIEFRERMTGVLSTERRVAAQVSRTLREDLRPGQIANLILNEKSYSGEILSVAEIANSTTGLYAVVIESNSPVGSKPNTSVIVDVVVSTLRNALRVPVSAIRRMDKKNNVWKISDGKAEEVSVSFGRISPDYIEVLSGLTKNDRIVVRGQGMLEAGDRVMVKNLRSVQ